MTVIACAMSRELILKSMVEKLRDFYDFIQNHWMYAISWNDDN